MATANSRYPARVDAVRVDRAASIASCGSHSNTPPHSRLEGWRDDTFDADVSPCWHENTSIQKEGEDVDRFKNILVAASPGHVEPLTLRAAVDLARVNDAHLAVMDVVAPLPGWRKSMNLGGVSSISRPPYSRTESHGFVDSSKTHKPLRTPM